MDGNKDEALRCVCIAEEAISAGNKERALKFIKLAQRLNHSLQVDELLAACENLNSGRGSSKSGVDEKRGENKSKAGPINSGAELNGESIYTQEHVQLIKQITRNKDYYSVLGVEKTCSVEEIKKAYRKLSLKVHPDKNKAPGSEEAFKKVCKAFKCLSDDGSRRQYDHTGLIEEYEHNQQYSSVRQRRRRTEHDLFDDNFDPNEIFRAFFGQGDVFRTSHVYRAGGMHSQTRTDFQGSKPNFFLLLQILPFLLIFLLAYLPFSEPEYSLHKNDSYTILLATEKHGVEFYVKSSAFDEKYPHGSGARADMENMVLKDHRNMLWRYCHIELQRRQWNRNLPTPHCDKLQTLEVVS